MNAVAGWGDGSDVEFTSLRERSERTEWLLWYNGFVNRVTNSVVNGRIELRRGVIMNACNPIKSDVVLFGRDVRYNLKGVGDRDF